MLKWWSYERTTPYGWRPTNANRRTPRQGWWGAQSLWSRRSKAKADARRACEPTRPSDPIGPWRRHSCLRVLATFQSPVPAYAKIAWKIGRPNTELQSPVQLQARKPAPRRCGLARNIVAPRTTPRKTPMNRAKSSLIQVNRTTARKDGFSPVLFADVAWPAREGFRSSRLNIWVLFPPIRENSRHLRQSSPFGFRPSNLTRVGQPMSHPSCENRAMNDDLITLGGGGSHFF